MIGRVSAVPVGKSRGGGRGCERAGRVVGVPANNTARHTVMHAPAAALRALRTLRPPLRDITWTLFQAPPLHDGPGAYTRRHFAASLSKRRQWPRADTSIAPSGFGDGRAGRAAAQSRESRTPPRSHGAARLSTTPSAKEPHSEALPGPPWSRERRGVQVQCRVCGCEGSSRRENGQRGAWGGSCGAAWAWR